VVCSAGTMTTAYGNYNRLRRTAGTATTGYLYWGQFEGTWAGDRWGIWTNAATRNQISGSVSMPNQPSFHAGNTSSTTYSANQIVIFSSVINNNGSHYNSSTGRFTAPVTGRYFFYANILTSNTATVVDFRFYVNSANTGAGGYSSNFGGFKQANGFIIRQLNQNDIVDIRPVSTGGWHGDSAHTYWGGMLLG
jgi:hypothetical protein